MVPDAHGLRRVIHLATAAPFYESRTQRNINEVPNSTDVGDWLLNNPCGDHSLKSIKILLP
jgi:hypothetical protein